jgi:O-antigen/teichoic acid export membrane protein
MRLDPSPWVVALVANLLIGFLGIVTSSLTARGLGPTGRGILVAAMLWPSLVISLGALINTQSVAYFWAKTKSSGDYATTWTASLVLLGLLTLVLLPMAWLVNWLTLGWQSQASLKAANLYAWTIPVSLLSGCLVAIFLAEQRIATFWGVRIASAVLYLVLLVVLFLTGNFKVLNCVLGLLVSVAGTTLFALLMYLRNFDATLSWNAGLVKSLATYGAKINLSGFPYQLNVRLDQLLMSLLLPEEALGYYAISVAWSSMLSFVGGGVSTVMLSRSVVADCHDRRHLFNLLTQFRLVSVLIVVLGVGTLIVTPIGLPLLFGSDFKPSILPAMILCLASVVLNVNVVLHELTRGLGFPELGIRAEMVGLLVAAPLLALLLPLWQGIGAAVVAIISRTFALGVLIHLFVRKIDVPVSVFVIPTRSDWVHVQAWLKSGKGWLS